MTTKVGHDQAAARSDLTVTRIIDAPPALVWRGWADPEHLKKWWAPAPFTTPECEIDLRPGGVFRTVMRGPDGQEYPGNGCILDVVPYERIVFTDALEASWWPAAEAFFTAIITLEEHEGGTRYTARALHKNAADREKHAQMGFVDGWGRCIDQLAALVKSMKKDAQPGARGSTSAAQP